MSVLTQSLGDALTAIAVNGVLLWAAWGLSEFVRGRGGSAFPLVERSALVLVSAVSLVVLLVTMGGVLGVLDRRAVMLGLGVAVGFATGALARRASRSRGIDLVRADEPREDSPSWRAASGSVAAGALCVAVTWALLLAERITLPPVAWDALTYHLHFPVMWLQEGSLVTTATPVGDPSNPYFPLVGEMLLYWTLLTTRTDLWTCLSQLPMALVSAGVVATLAVRCGSTRTLGALAGLGWLATPIVLRQSVEPMVDIQLATWWLLAVYVLVRWGDGARGAWLTLAGVCGGLLIGTKMSGLLYAAALLPVWIHARRARSEAGARTAVGDAAAAMLAVPILGGFAYLRNLVNGGNPFLPLEVRVGGHTLLQGITDRAYYFGSDAPRLSWADLFLSARAVLDTGFVFLPLLGFLVLGASWRPRGPRGALAASGAVAFILAAILLPYREHRYFIPVLGVGWSVAAAIVSSPLLERRARFVGLLLLLATAPVTLFYWGKDLVLAGSDVGHGAGIAAAALLLAAARFHRGMARHGKRIVRPSRGPLRAVALVAASLMVAAVLAWLQLRYLGARYALWERYWGSRHEWEDRATARPDYRDMSAAWSDLNERTHGERATIAYAGMNAPYPLTGERFDNRVRFVPRGGPADGSLYDWGSKPRASVDGSVETWIANLREVGTDYLCVFRVERRENPSARPPVEWEWAERMSGAFQLVWASDHARVYRVERAR